MKDSVLSGEVQGAIMAREDFIWGVMVGGHDAHYPHLYIVELIYSRTPIFMYDATISQWFGNSDERECTRSHRPNMEPNTEVTWCDGVGIRGAIKVGGYLNYCAAKASGDVLWMLL